VIDTNVLKGKIAENGLSQAKVAKEIGITPKTFYEKMNKGVFGSDEIEVMIKLLGIEEPSKIFFAQQVT
jgi:DNA-binding XRE family transcriptional regulator